MEIIVFDIEIGQIYAMFDIVWFAGYLFLTIWVWKPAWIKKLRIGKP